MSVHCAFTTQHNTIQTHVCVTLYNSVEFSSSTKQILYCRLGLFWFANKLTALTHFVSMTGPMVLPEMARSMKTQNGRKLDKH